MAKQERAARTRRALIRAAAEVFAEEGYVSASLTAISRRAGVSNGALHFHFESKTILAQAVEEEALQVVRRITGGPDRDGGYAPQRLVDATHQLIRGIADNVVVRAGFGLCGDPARRGGRLRREWQSWIEGVLRCAKRDGWLAEGASAENAAHLIVATTVGFEVLGRENEWWLSERRVTGMWDLLLPRLTDERTLAALTSGPPRPAGEPLREGRTFDRLGMRRRP
jgi:AcrR family transcriptional regulator